MRKKRRRPGTGAPGLHLHSPHVDNRNRAEEQAELRFRCDVEQLHRLGPQATFQLLAELGARRLCMTEVEQLVAVYVARLSPELLAAVGGDRLPTLPPLRVVPR